MAKLTSKVKKLSNEKTQTGFYLKHESKSRSYMHKVKTDFLNPINKESGCTETNPSDKK